MDLRPLPPVGRTHIMGVLNLTPDSFSDGARHATPESALEAARTLVAEGAALLDVGAVSTRPGADSVSVEEEWRRLEPVLRRVRSEVDVPISLDTTSAEVLSRAAELGVDVLNDVSALADDPELGPLAAELGLPVILMHRRGSPADMQRDPHYDDVSTEVLDELLGRVEHARDVGLASEQLLLDPGIGFGKRLDDNLALLAALPRLVALGHRTVLGCSRKAFLGALTGRAVGEREHATTATTVIAAQAGVDFVRVHEPAAARDALAVIAAVSVASPAIPG